MDAKLTERDVRLTAKRVAEDGHALAAHFEFERNGGRLFWIVDTDVVNLFLNPREKARYANLFRHRNEKSTTPRPELIALAALLSDFIFGERFHCSPVSQAGREHAAEQKLMLASHVSEFQEVLSAIAEKAIRDGDVAKNAIERNRLPDKVRRLIEEYLRDKEQAPEVFINKVQKAISDDLNFILPHGSLEELKRARDLLKTRKAVVYEADCEWMQKLLSSEESQRVVDNLADKWRSAILIEAEREAARKATRDEGKKGVEQKPVSRPGDQDLRNHRDARALAQLEYLDSLSHQEEKATRRFVFVTGHGLLHVVAGDLNRSRQGRIGQVYLLHPRVFLGSPDLFPLPEDEGRRIESDHWVRLTRALTLLERKELPKSVIEDKSERTAQCEGDNQELVDRIQAEWARLMKFTLTFAPAQSREKATKDILVDLLQGKTLDALERTLYLALSELFVVLAELGLAPHYEREFVLPQRRPPPLRLAYYPAAEECIRALIGGATDAHGASAPEIGTLIGLVKNEQKESGIEDFNYPLLVCLAERFASLGDWHAARIIANYAASVAKVTEHVAPLVTGREAALLECYCRRVEAKTIHDLDRAEDALSEYDVALKREIDWRESHPNESGKEPRFNPFAEFPLHRLRGESEKLTLDLTRLMFGWFCEEKDFLTLLESLRKDEMEILSLNRRANSLHLKIDSEYSVDGEPLEMVSQILTFVKLQTAICMAQCSILLTSINSSAEDIFAMPPVDLMSHLRGSSTAVTTMLVLVMECLWGTIEERAIALSRLNSHSCSDALMPHDVARCSFFKELAQREVQ